MSLTRYFSTFIKMHSGIMSLEKTILKMINPEQNYGVTHNV